MSRIICGRIKPGLGEDDTIKVEGNLTVTGEVADDSANPWGIISGSNANGNYTKFPDGTLMCWGETGVISSESSEVITWPIAFTAKPSVSACSLTRNSYNVSFGSGGNNTGVTTTTGTLYTESGATNVASWIAIGRWK